MGGTLKQSDPMGFIANREAKMEVLARIAARTLGRDHDVIQGIIADYHLRDPRTQPKKPRKRK